MPPKKKNTERWNLTVDGSLDDRIKKASEETDVPISAIIRRAVDAHLKEMGY